MFFLGFSMVLIRILRFLSEVFHGFSSFTPEMSQKRPGDRLAVDGQEIFQKPQRFGQSARPAKLALKASLKGRLCLEKCLKAEPLKQQPFGTPAKFIILSSFGENSSTFGGRDVICFGRRKTDTKK